MEKCRRVRQATCINILRRMRIASRIIKVIHTHIHPEYMILIAFHRQQWLRERPSVLRLLRTLPVFLFVFISVPPMLSLYLLRKVLDIVGCTGDI